MTPASWARIRAARRSQARALTLLPLLAVGLPAQDQERIDLDQGGRMAVELRLETTPGGARIGGYGWALLELESRDGRSHTMGLRIETGRFDRVSVVASCEVRLEPGSIEQVILPLPSVKTNASLYCVLDGDSERPFAQVNLSTEHTDLSVLAVSERAEEAEDWQRSIGRSLSRGRGGSLDVDMAVRAPGRLPDRWTMLSGFDLIIVDGRAELGAGHQELLRRYLATGGALLILVRDLLPPGPLQDLLIEADTNTGRYMLGAYCAVDDAVDLDHYNTRSWLREGAGLLTVGNRISSGPVPDAMNLPLDIPGIGKVPVRMFMVLILAFAVLVGPVNFIALRRRRRPMLVLFTVPLLGFGFTAAILMFGFFSEGFGVKGVLRSFTVIDQARHEAVILATRTLYAGLSPSALSPAPQSYLFAAQVVGFRWDESPTHALEIDLDRERVGGALLPSRNPTALATTTWATARQRLRFRRHADDVLEVLAGDDLLPARGQPLLLRDLRGRYWAGAGDELRPLSGRRHPRNQLDAYRKMLATHPTGRSGHQLRANWERTAVGWRANRRATVGMDSRLEGYAHRAIPSELPPGTYLAVVDAAPWIDDLGLDVAWRGQEHLVMGRVAEEDFLP